MTRLIKFALILFFLFPNAHAAEDKDIEVFVETHGEQVVVDTRVTVRASLEQTWAVLTDFDHMERFISNLSSSRIVSSPTDHLIQVEQKGAVSYGPLSIAFDSTNQNELTPYKSIKTKLTHGTFIRFDSMTLLVAEADMTKIIYHGEAIPEIWLPPIIGPALVRIETRKKFTELRDEILRRKQLAPVNQAHPIPELHP